VNDQTKQQNLVITPHAWHTVAHRSNERLDCLVYSLAALIHSRVNLDKLSGPLIVPEAKEQPPQRQAMKRPTWGAQPGTGVLLDGAPIGPKVPVGSAPQHQERPRSRFGVQNVPLQW